MEKFDKLIQKRMKSQKPMSDLEKNAKMGAVHEMRKMASDEMALPLKSLKKVSVASDSPEGMKHGLEKAQEIINKMPGAEGSMEEEASESPSEEAMEDMHPEMEMGESEHELELPEHMSEEEIDQAMQELMKKKEQLKHKM